MSRCQHCGQRLPRRESIARNEVFEPKLRAGLTSAYLWFGLIVNSIMAIAYFATIFTSRGLWSAYDPMSSRILGFIASAICVWGYVNLFRWKRLGFYILVVMGILSLIGNFVGGDRVTLSTFGPIVSIAILYGVLQLTKSGKSCWNQLT